MKKFLKNGLSLFLVLAIIFSLFLPGFTGLDLSGVFVVKAEASNIYDFAFERNEDDWMTYCLYLCYNDTEGEVVIPETYYGYPVTRIEPRAFQDCEKITSVVIPDTITEIDDYVFYNCTRLKSVTIPDSVTSIGLSAFRNCKRLDSITIPDSVTSIANNAFRDCKSLTSIKIPENAYVADSAFRDCISLKTIMLPDSLIGIGYLAFYNTAYYNNKKNWDASAFYIGNHLIRARTSLKGDYEIKKGTATIAGSAFLDRTNITTITFPDSVKYIEWNAFENCTELKNLTISRKLKSIEREAFLNCKSLESVTIPDSVTYIGWSAFGNCSSLTEVKLPKYLKSISNYAFGNCTKLNSIIIPDTARGISNFTFYNTAYYNNKKNWDKDVLYIGNHLISAKESLNGAYKIKKGTITVASDAFYNCSKLTEITISESVKHIDIDAFYGCNALGKVYWNAKSMEDLDRYYIFYNAGKKESGIKLIFGKSVERIPANAVRGCVAVTSITIPDTVKSIGYLAFYNTAYYNDRNNWDESALYIGNHLIRGRHSLTGDYEVKKGTITIADKAFRNCDKLTSVKFPSSVKNVGKNIFYQCDKID